MPIKVEGTNRRYYSGWEPCQSLEKQATKKPNTDLLEQEHPEAYETHFEGVRLTELRIKALIALKLGKQLTPQMSEEIKIMRMLTPSKPKFDKLVDCAYTKRSLIDTSEIQQMPDLVDQSAESKEN